MAAININDVHNLIIRINDYLSPITNKNELAIDLGANPDNIKPQDKLHVENKLRLISRDVDYTRAILRELVLFSS